VIQECGAWLATSRTCGDRFAAEGFVALAPDLYHGTKVAEPGEAAKLMMALELDRAGATWAVPWTRSRRDRAERGVGVVGFCMGGGLALMLASQRPDKVRAVVPFYGLRALGGRSSDYFRR